MTSSNLHTRTVSSSDPEHTRGPPRVKSPRAKSPRVKSPRVTARLYSPPRWALSVRSGAYVSRCHTRQVLSLEAETRRRMAPATWTRDSGDQRHVDGQELSGATWTRDSGDRRRTRERDVGACGRRVGSTELIKHMQVVESRCGVAAAEDVDSPAIRVLHRSRHVAGARLGHRAGTREGRPLQLLCVEDVHVSE